MRVICGIASIIASWLALNISTVAAWAPGDKDPVTVETYACMAQRVVGIQGDKSKGTRYHGPIVPPPEDERFLITITAIDETKREWCSSPIYQPKEGLRFWYFCRTKFELRFSKGKGGMSLRSDDVHVFHDELLDNFQITIDFSYRYSRSDYVGNHYLEEGECQKY
jgi:hypothetical protein